MRRSLLGLLLLLPCVLASSNGLLGISTPLLVWSNRGLVGQGNGPQVSYQVVANVEELASNLVLKAVGKAGAGKLDGLLQAGTTAVVVFIGSQLDAADLRQGADAAGQLESILGGAVSSMVMPYATSKGAPLRDVLSGKLGAAGVSYETVGCVDRTANLAVEAAAKLQDLADGETVVLVVCSAVDAAQDSTNAALEHEVTQLKAVQAAVEASGVSSVFLYTTQPLVHGKAMQSRRRSLLTATGFGSYTVCGPLCQTQVRWLEAMIFVLLLALATCAGLTCLYVLDTPTRFDAPKEGSS